MFRTIFFFSLPLIFFFSSCSDNKTTDEKKEIEEKTETDNLLTGTWQMDSSLYLEDDHVTTVAAPILPTTWNFSEDGSYQVKNSLIMTGTYTRSDDSVYVVLMHVPNSYEIISLTDSYLRLRSTIVNTDSLRLQTDACLTRKKE